MNPSLRILADENMPALEPLFSHLGEVVRVNGRTLTPEQMVGADVLLVRSVTQVDARLLSMATPRFIGSATIGTDHVDLELLAQRGIAFVNAPGCNAEAVVDYVLSALFHLAAEQSFDPFSKVVGIIGVGQVGRRLQARLSALGIEVVCCDPPRQRQEGGDWLSLSELLQQSDVVTVHTPLTRTGSDPTWHLLDAPALALLRPHALLINAARGAVIDNAALLAVKQVRPDLTLVLDVWEGEPEISLPLAQRVALASPHVAGYSLEGKIRGSYQLAQALHAHLQHPLPVALEALLPPPPLAELVLGEGTDLLPALTLCHDPWRDDRALRASLKRSEEQRGQAFDYLRRHYRQRREFSSLRVQSPDVQLRQRLQALGFQVRAPHA